MDNPGRGATGNLGTYGYGSSTPQGERTIGDILKDIVTNLQSIIRSEMQLAAVELKREGKKLITASGALAAAAVFGVFGVGFIFLTAMFALELVLAPWLSALIVGVVLLVCAGVGLAMGRERLRAVQAPKATLETLKEDAQWTKEQVRS
jgi:uncharacterized membrane protein YqjE